MDANRQEFIDLFNDNITFFKNYLATEELTEEQKKLVRIEIVEQTEARDRQ